MTFKTFEEFRKASLAAGHQDFSPKALDFWDTKFLPETWREDGLFVSSSRQFHPSNPLGGHRYYFIHRADPETLGFMPVPQTDRFETKTEALKKLDDLRGFVALTGHLPGEEDPFSKEASEEDDDRLTPSY